MPPGVTVGSTSIPVSLYAGVAEHLFPLAPHETGAVSTPGVGYYSLAYVHHRCCL